MKLQTKQLIILITWLTFSFCCLIAFPFIREAAAAQRGCSAIGGEVLFLLLPALTFFPAREMSKYVQRKAKGVRNVERLDLR